MFENVRFSIFFICNPRIIWSEYGFIGCIFSELITDKENWVIEVLDVWYLVSILPEYRIDIRGMFIWVITTYISMLKIIHVFYTDKFGQVVLNPPKKQKYYQKL